MMDRVEICWPVPDEGVELCHPRGKGEFPAFHATFDGTPRQRTWRSPPMRLIRKDMGKRRFAADSPWLSHYCLIFRTRAIDALSDILVAHGELLPLDCPGEDLVLFNATRVLDALDEQASNIARFPDGRIMLIERHVLRPDIVAGVDIFRLARDRTHSIYVSARFVDRFQAAGLRGLVFEKVWSA